MKGACVPCNTCWMQFGRRRTTSEQAADNSRLLFEAAAQAGVGGIVHFSVASAPVESGLLYFRGKWRVEKLLRNTGIPCDLITPTLVFVKGGGKKEGDHAVAGQGEDTCRVQHLTQHGVQVQALVDAQAGLAQPGQPFPQGPGLSQQVVIPGPSPAFNGAGDGRCSRPSRPAQ